jgi:general secretion pathway protein G
MIKRIKKYFIKSLILPARNATHSVADGQSTTYNLQPSSGFTLVEILVSATIIGLLSTIGITGFQAITKSGRDALRKSDLEQIRSALEIFKSENGSYPTNTAVGSCLPNSLVPNYINTYPTDPKNTNYRYCYIQDSNLTYRLCAHLENGTTAADATKCGDSGGTICTSNCNYQVSNP